MSGEKTLEAAVLSVQAAVNAYLPPDGISRDHFIERVLEAVDNPGINEASGLEGVWLPASAVSEEMDLDQVVVAFVREDGQAEYDRRRICNVRKRDWPKRYEFWDLKQRVHPTHFFLLPHIQVRTSTPIKKATPDA